MPARVSQWLSIARAVGPLYDIDPLLILAIMDRESGGGEFTQPRGPAGLGDGGHGHGLMQIDDRYHSTFIAAKGPDGKPLWTKPLFNVGYAVELLHFNYLAFNGGSGLRAILPAIAAYNASAKRVREALRGLTRPASDVRVIAVLDPLTTGKNYVSDVLARRANFAIA